MADTQEYRALVGMNYTNEKGNEVRVEAGDKITDMPENETRHQERKKNIEPWEPRKTENVQTGEGVEVQGVQSQHANQGEDIVLKEADK